MKKKNYCLDCGKKTKGFGKRCYSCNAKYRFQIPKNCPSFIDGRCSKKYFCIDCGKELIGHNKPKRCKSCAAIERTKIPKNCSRYIDGRSREPYPLKFNDRLKEQIRTRDNYTCQNCGMSEEEHLIVYDRVLEIHHINYDKINCYKDNLITLCKQCNVRANSNRKYWQELFIKNYLIRR